MNPKTKIICICTFTSYNKKIVIGLNATRLEVTKEYRNLNIFGLEKKMVLSLVFLLEPSKFLE